MNEIANYFIAFFRDHSFLNYIIVAFALIVVLVGYAGGRRLLGLKLKAWWGTLLDSLLLSPIWFCIGIIGVVPMIFLRVFECSLGFNGMISLKG